MTVENSQRTPSPIACSLHPAEQVIRRREFLDLMDQALLARDSTDGELFLRFRASPEVSATVEDLVRRERACCPFFDFELLPHGDELWLRVVAPEEAHGILAGLFTR